MAAAMRWLLATSVMTGVRGVQVVQEKAPVGVGLGRSRVMEGLAPPRVGVVPLKPSHKSGREKTAAPGLSAASFPASVGGREVEKSEEERFEFKNRYEAEFENPDWRERYWADPRMHGFGNCGTMGAVFHAVVAPLFTFILDQFAYDGKDVRQEAWKFIKRARQANIGAPRVSSAVDLGCGTGFTARSLARAFFSRDAKKKREVDVVALDTSPEMLRVAKDLTALRDDVTVNSITYSEGNAENTGLASSTFDVVVASFVFHECPREARHKILEEGLRLLAPGGTLAVLDIHTDYKPSNFMLPGEPYLFGYLDHFEQDASEFATRHAHHFAAAHRDVVVPGRLILWHFHSKPANPPDLLIVKDL